MTPEERLERRKPTIEECQRLRGWLINSFAQVEFLLGDIVCRAWELPEYAHLKRQVPMGVSNRLKSVREVLAAGGPLAAFRDRLEAPLGEFERVTEIRHFLTHGFVSFDFTPAGEAAMRFRRYVPPDKGGTAELLELYMRPDELRAAHERWSRFAANFVEVSSALYLQLGLEDAGPVAQRVVYRHDLKPGSRST